MDELESANPLYVQIALDLKGRIERGEFRVGDMLPSEGELVGQYSGGRATLRAAVEMLAERGYVVKKQGVGTRVTCPPIEARRHQPLSFSENMAQHSLKASTSILTFTQQLANAEQQQKLHLSASDLVIFMVRLRFTNRLPALYEETCLPLALFPDLQREEVETTGLYNVLGERFYLLSIAAQESYFPCLPEADMAKKLDIPSGQPCMRVERLASRRKDNVPFEFTRGWANSERYPLTFRFVSG